jgi:preprotein translocase subunit SecA
VEAYHFDIRKYLLEYDDVMNMQREVIYSQRKEILKSESIKDWIFSLIDETCEELVEETILSERNLQPEEVEALVKRYQEVFAIPLKLPENLTTKSQILSYLKDFTKQKYEEKEKNIGSDLMRNLEKYFLLTTIDNLWKEHLLMLDYVKESVGLRGYGQKNPLQEYKKEAYHLFVALMKRIRETTLSYLFRIELREEAEKVQEMVLEEGEIDESKLKFAKKDLFAEEERKNQPIKTEKVGRNDPCPCGSGKKYKKCCGREVLETNKEERHEVSQL